MSMQSSVDATPVQRPTHVRHLVVALTTLMAFLLYLDRFCLSFAASFIKQEMGLTEGQISYLLGAFFLAYALGQVPAGWLSDKFGSRKMLTIYILLWSLFTGWMGLASSFVMVLVLRLGCGLAQAGAYPTGASVISKWVLFSSRGLASAIVSVGGRIGGAAAPVLTAYLIIACVPRDTRVLLQDKDIRDHTAFSKLLKDPGEGSQGDLRRALDKDLGHLLFQIRQSVIIVLDVEHINKWMTSRDMFAGVNLDDVPLEKEGRALAKKQDLSPDEVILLNRFLLEAAFPDQILKYYSAGWRPVMLIYGLAGILVAGAYWWVVRDKPRDNPKCNAAEIELIEQSLPRGAPNPHGKVEGIPWRPMLVHFSLWMSSVVQFFGTFGWTFLLLYLPRYLAEMKVPVVERGWMSGFPIFAGMFGMFAGGYITDWAAGRFGVRRGRMLPVLFTRFLAAGAFFACLFLQTPWPVTIALAVVAVATDLGTASAWAYAQDVGGRHSGSVLGWSNMWGNLGATLSPIVLNLIVESKFGWNGAFATCGLAFLISGILSYWIDATVPLLPPGNDIE